jgi:hypothetical protein
MKKKLISSLFDVQLRLKVSLSAEFASAANEIWRNHHMFSKDLFSSLRIFHDFNR